ncbi:MAG: glycosyltransferase family A protein [Chitinophagaceae bacterium]
MQISIIIPTLNRAKLLERTLQSIFNQEPPGIDFEVIIVDNGSSDDTARICDTSSPWFTHFQYIYDDVPGQLTGRHRGLKESKGELLCYFDDDVILNPRWIKSIAELSEKYPHVEIFGGPSIPEYEVNPPAWLDHFWENTPYGGKVCLPLSLIDLQIKEGMVDPLYVFGLNFSIRRETLLRLRGFHPDCVPSKLQMFQGDGETGLAIKASMNKIKAFQASALSVKHQITHDRLTIQYFEKWSFYNGVCQSFTDLRRNNHLYSLPETDASSQSGFPYFAKCILNRVSGKLKILMSPQLIKEITRRIHTSYQNGYKFHQDAFRSDEKVKNWVLKPDFLDYTLPVAS